MKELHLQQENVKELLRLIEENPELKIVPVVYSEIVADDGYTWWLGSFGKARVDEIVELDERIYIRSEDEETLIENRYDELDEDLNFTDEEAWEKAKKDVANYAWEKVITVRIDLP